MFRVEKVDSYVPLPEKYLGCWGSYAKDEAEDAAKRWNALGKRGSTPSGALSVGLKHPQPVYVVYKEDANEWGLVSP